MLVRFLIDSFVVKIIINNHVLKLFDYYCCERSAKGDCDKINKDFQLLPDF